ncbi:hypothetical protein ACEPAH_9299 [Sanghuangporus vaninii]
MFLINSGTPVIMILITSAFGVQSVPVATRLLVIQQRDGGITRRATTFSQIGCLSDCSEDRLGYLMTLELTKPRAELVEARISTSSHIAPLAAPLAPLACVTSLLLVLLILKATYLKNRRLRTIHELPSLCAAWSEGEDEESTDDHVVPRFGDVRAGADLHSMQNRFCRRASERSSALSSKSEPVHRQLRDSLPGVLVGMLGSPDWETRMQRELANHQWRLRRESRNLSIKSHRHTWHSRQSCTYPHNSMASSHLTSTSRNHLSYRPGRHSSLRIPHVSSFGEMYPDTFRDKRRRPRSLNAVLDQMSTSRSGSIPSCSPAPSNICQMNQYANEAVGGSGFSVPAVSLNQRPSTIREVDTPPPTVTLPQEAIFRFQVTDYGDGMPFMNSAVAASAQSPFMTCFGSTESGLGSVDMEELSSTYEHLNASRESSLGSSWRQLPHFPSPPASPDSPQFHTPQFPDAVQVNAVRVRPHYFSDGFYDAMSTKSGIFGASGLRLFGKDRYSKPPRKTMSAFSPLTLDLGFPALSDLVVSDLLKLSSSPVDEMQNNGMVHVRQSPVKSELSSPPAPKRQFLDPLTAVALNRNHSRVREHVPFSITTPPPAYLKSPRSLERSIRFTQESKSVEDGSGKCLAVPYATSLVDLSAPVRPSPLRRVASLGSIGSSRTSLRNRMKLGNTSKGSNASSDAAMDRAGEKARESRDSSLQVMEVDFQTLRPRASHTSLFLDLAGSSPGYDDDRSESYSFGIAESFGTLAVFLQPILKIEVPCTGIDQSFNYSQASSSGIVVVMEDYSVEDVEYIVEMHSDSFASVQNSG